MAKYRKKPVVIDAWQWLPSKPEDFQPENWPEWVRDGYVKVTLGERLEVITLEGVMTAGAGDWIIQGVKGEIYPCKPDIFAATYEPA